MENMGFCDQFVSLFPRIISFQVAQRVVQQDFPFFIRIPESLPPTIALEKGGRFRPHIAPHSVAYYGCSWYQVRVDCYGLHQG